MKIGVFVKQVVDVASVRIDTATGAPTMAAKPVMNTADARAVAWAVDLRGHLGGQVFAITLGPVGAREVVTSALATGVDVGIHVISDDVEKGDSLAVARALAGAVGGEGFDVLVAGSRSDDDATGQVAIQVAEMLGRSHLSGVISVAREDDGLTVHRDVDGFPEDIAIAPPVVVILKESDEAPTRHPSLRGMMQAKRRPVREVTAAAEMTTPLTWSAPMGQRVNAERILLEGEPAGEAAAKLAAWLREHRLVG